MEHHGDLILQQHIWIFEQNQLGKTMQYTVSQGCHYESINIDVQGIDQYGVTNDTVLMGINREGTRWSASSVQSGRKQVEVITWIRYKTKN